MNIRKSKCSYLKFLLFFKCDKKKLYKGLTITFHFKEMKNMLFLHLLPFSLLNIWSVNSRHFKFHQTCFGIIFCYVLKQTTLMNIATFKFANKFLENMTNMTLSDVIILSSFKFHPSQPGPVRPWVPNCYIHPWGI